MGILSRFRDDDSSATEIVLESILEFEKALENDNDFRIQVMAIVAFMLCIGILRFFSASRMQALKGERVLDLSALNNAKMYQEVFLAYLNAAILEPILSIAGMEELVVEELLINILTLGSICFWIWLVTDAFDYDDIFQHYFYHVNLRDEKDSSKDPSQYAWLQLSSRAKDSTIEKRSLVGSVRKDIALWFMLACIAAPWLPGAVSHSDVMHAYALVILWAFLHHACRKASVWSTGYFVTFLFPSTALMPMEYCLPLMDCSDVVGDLAFVVSYRQYVKERTGIEIIIRS